MNHMVRFAEIQDYEGVSKLVSQLHRLHAKARPDLYASFDRPMGLGYFKKILGEERSALVVVEDEDTHEILAYTVIAVEEAERRPIYQRRRYIWVDDFCVDENVRGEGIGRALFEFIEKYAQEISVTRIELSVDEFNTSAIQFYESVGMKSRSRKLEYMLGE